MQHINLKELDNLKQFVNQTIVFYGTVTKAAHLSMRTGKKYGNFALIDETGVWEFPLFGEDYQKYQEILKKNNQVGVSAKIQNRPWGNVDELEIKILNIQKNTQSLEQ